MGEGESLGERNLTGGSRASVLKFRSGDPRSIIREGSGYWKYIPTPDGIRFLTSYDYETRFGWPGVVFDRLVFRRMLGWATAWSFDRLRLWLERGIPPGVALRLFAAHVCARSALAFVFAYHGLVPKLWLGNVDEIAMLRDGHVPPTAISTVLSGVGLAEILLSFVLLVLWRCRWPLLLCILLMAAATATVAITSPRYLGAAFNPITLNVSVAALAFVDLVVQGDAPSAGLCRRTPPPGELMRSIYQRALGSDFHRLHPEIQRRFGFSSADRVASVGRGVMDEVWRGAFYTVPFLYVGTWRRIMFPEVGHQIPFTIENYAFIDSFGRETMSWVRTFESTCRRRFDAYMIYSEERGRIVDYLGSHEHLAVDIELRVTERGGLALAVGLPAVL